MTVHQNDDENMTQDSEEEIQQQPVLDPDEEE